MGAENAVQAEADRLEAENAVGLEADRLAAEVAPRDALSTENLRNSGNLFNPAFIMFVVRLVLLVIAVHLHVHVWMPYLKTANHYRNCDRSWRFSPPGLRHLRSQGMLGFGTSTCGCGYSNGV